MNAPDFFIIGAQKCGTTSLHGYLKDHPELCMSVPKEPHLMTRHYERVGAGGYDRVFSHRNGHRLCGEASTSYSMAPLYAGVPQRIAAINPTAKLVYLVRDPLDRIQSMYRYSVDRGLEKAPNIDVAVRDNPHYLDNSRYGYQLSLYLDHFARDQLLVLFSEELQTDRSAAVRRVLDFLSVDLNYQPEVLDREMNRTPSPRRVSPWVEGPRRMWSRARSVTGRIPKPLRKKLKRIVSQPLEDGADILSQGVREHLTEILRRDGEVFRDLTGLAPP